MPDTWKPEFSALEAHTIVDFEMAGLHADLDPKTSQGENTSFTER